MRQQLALLRDPRVWKYCQYYSIVFGGFTALSIWMPQYFKNEYGFSIAQASLLAACFSLPGGAFRAVGGWLSDRFGAHNVTWWVLWAAWIALFLLSYPRTELIVHTVDGPVQFRRSRCRPGCSLVADRARCRVRLRHGVDVQVHRRRFSRTAWAPSLALSVWPVALAGFCCRSCSARSWIGSGINSSCFMLLYGIVWVSLVLNYLTEVRRAPVMGEAMQQITVTGSR